MKRIAVIFFFILLSSFCSPGASFPVKKSAEDELWPTYQDDCYIAFLEENIGEGKQLLYQQVDEEASRGLNVTRMFEFKNIEPGFVFMGDKDSAKKVAKMRGVKSVIPDYVVVGQEARSVQWHLDRTDQRYLPLDNSYNPFGNGSGVDIYVLDSGANFNHTDIKDSLVYPGRDIIDEVTGSSRKGSDCYGHGTHVAGLAAGKTYGIAPGATIIVIRVLDCRNYGPYTAVMLGIDYVLELIKERKRKAVVSMSLVGFGDIHFDHSVEKLLKTGVPVVAAAGNYKMSACYYSPSRISNVITVGATRQESDGMFWFSNQSSSGTNYGPCVDIFAPGQFVTSAGVECSDCESSRSGTSMATPLVSGMVALLLQKYPNYTAETIKEKLLQLSTKNVLDFSSLPMDKDKEASKTPNRLLYVPRQGDMEVKYTASSLGTSSSVTPLTTTSPTTDSSKLSPTSTILLVVTTPSTTSVSTTSTPSTSNAKATPSATPSDAPPTTPTMVSTTTPTLPTTTVAPSTTTTAAPTTPPSSTTTTIPTTPTAPNTITVPTTPTAPNTTTIPTTPTAPNTTTSKPNLVQLSGTIFEKSSSVHCHGRLLDSSSAVIYRDIPKSSLEKYVSNLRELGYSLTSLSVMSYRWNVESKFIMIFSIKKKVLTMPVFRQSYINLRLEIIRHGAQHYYPHSIVPSVEMDEEGRPQVVYSAILYKDNSLKGVQISRIVSKVDAVNYMHRHNGTNLKQNFELQHVSSLSYPVSLTPGTFLPSSMRLDYIVILKRHRRYRHVNFAAKTLEEVRDIIAMMHRSGFYLERFDSHWVSDMQMTYNLVFTNESKENCNYKLIMDMKGSTLQTNVRLLLARGWTLTLVGTHMQGFSLNFIAVWWK